MSSTARKDRHGSIAEDSLLIDGALQRVRSLDVPAVLTLSNGHVIGTNAGWDALVDRLSVGSAAECWSPVDVLGSCLDVGSRDRLCMVADRVLAAAPMTSAVDLTIRQDGVTIPLRVAVIPLMDQHAMVAAAIWTIEDVTAEHKSEALNRHQEKMKAISRLSAGIAHEFNNLLTAVLGNLEIMRAKLPETITGHLEAAESAAVRATRLIQELRHFGTRQLSGLKPQPVRPVVEKAVQILRGMCPTGVNVVSDLGGDEALSAGIDADLLQDVILRIGQNSLEAIPETGGVIKVRADVVGTTDTDPLVRIQILDDGPGLEDPVSELACEPFFTTRDPNSNAGLGLAIAYGLVEEMGGSLEIHSDGLRGTSVTIFLPFVDVPVRTPLPPAAKSVEVMHVGLVDNEPGVRTVGVGMLKLIGHEVTTYASGRELLDDLEGGQELDVILLDRAMPAMSGRETYSHLREAGCTSPVVICSGMSVELSTFCARHLQPPEGFLAKPFTLAALSSAIDRACQAR